MRYTQKRNGVNEIPLLNAVCGTDVPYWRIDRHDSLHSYLSGDAADKLAAYEDAEEQGLLVRLPCKVGTTVYFIKKTGFHPELIETRIEEIGVRRGGMFVKLACNSMYRTAISAWGKTVFLSREAAEAALKGEQGDV